MQLEKVAAFSKKVIIFAKTERIRLYAVLTSCLGSMRNGWQICNLSVPSDRIMPCLFLRNAPFLVYPKNVNINIL